MDVEKTEHNPFKYADASAHSDTAKLLIGLEAGQSDVRRLVFDHCFGRDYQFVS